MRSVVRLIFPLMLAVALPVAAACGGGSAPTASHTGHDSSTKSESSTKSGSSGSSESTVSDSQSISNVQLDPAVSMPAGFPHDFPIYKGARLTSQGQYKSSGVTAWAMTWETFDPAEKVGKWYEDELNKGDWTVTFSGSTTGNYSVTFTRKSNNDHGGLLGVYDDSGFTKINAVFDVA